MGPFISIINKELVYTIQVKRTKNRKRIHTEGAGGRMRGQAKGCIHNQVVVYKLPCIISTVSESSATMKALIQVPANFETHSKDMTKIWSPRTYVGKERQGSWKIRENGWTEKGLDTRQLGKTLKAERTGNPQMKMYLGTGRRQLPPVWNSLVELFWASHWTQIQLFLQ